MCALCGNVGDSDVGTVCLGVMRSRDRGVNFWVQFIGRDM